MAVAMTALAVALSHAADAAPGAALWVVQPSGELVAYSTRNFASIGGVRLPEFAFRAPACLSVNRRGEILARASGDSLWLWDGHRWRIRWRPANPRYLAPMDSTRGTCHRAWFLGGRGGSLFLLETSTVSWSGDPARPGTAGSGWAGLPRIPGVDSAHIAARMEETDFDLRRRIEVFDMPYARCEENRFRMVAVTGGCREAQVIAVGGIIDDFFVLDYRRALHPAGRIVVASATWHWRFYRRQGGTWRADTADARGDSYADDGRAVIGSDPEVGCCGWSNASSNNAWIRRDGATMPFFDEWGRYQNQDVDLSFFAESPLLSPDRTSIGFTVHGRGRLRGTSNGPADSLEILRAGEQLRECPVAEVVVLDPRPATRWRRAHAEFVGWLSPRRALVIEQNRLLDVDIGSGRARDTGITVRGRADVFLTQP
jgi:hypothetical protein